MIIHQKGFPTAIKRYAQSQDLSGVVQTVGSVLAGAAVIYISYYYHADITALDALRSDDLVTVTESGFGWFFDNDNRL